MHPSDAMFTLHSDTSDVVWGGTILLGSALPPGSPGGHEYQDLWNRDEGNQTILWREFFGLCKTLEHTDDLLNSRNRSLHNTIHILCHQPEIVLRTMQHVFYRAKHMHSKRRVYAVVSPPATTSSSPQNSIADEVAAICYERARRQAVPHLGSSRYRAEQSRAAISERYLQDHPRAFETDLCLSTACRAPRCAAQDDIGGLRSELERRSLPFLRSPHRHDVINRQ